MNLSLKAHFITYYVMEIYLEELFDFKSVNCLQFEKITEQNREKFVNDWLPLSMMTKGDFIGSFIEGKPAGIAGFVRRGGRGDYFNVRKCDLYLQKLYVFPEFRGRRVMGDIISYCIWKEMEKGTIRRVGLCVSPDNYSAIKCYERAGFRKVDTVRHLRFWKDVIFPRHTI